MTISERQAQRATRTNRDRQQRTERRMDELAAVADVETDYQRVDRVGDLQMESWFQRHYAAQTTDAGRTDVANGFAIWLRTERAEEGVVGGSVGDALTALRANNPYWLGEG